MKRGMGNHTPSSSRAPHQADPGNQSGKEVMKPMDEKKRFLWILDRRVVCFACVCVFAASVVLAAGDGPATQPNPVVASADATAKIVLEIVLSKTADLRFGAFSADPILDGHIIMNPETGIRTPLNVDLISNGVMGGIGAAAFTVTGSPFELLQVTLPTGPEPVCEGGGQCMDVVDFTHFPPTLQFDGAGNESFTVGARLLVNAAQKVADYAGSFNVTVDYQ